MAALSALYQYVLPDTPGCPELVLDQNIRQAAIIFMRDTGIYKVTVPSFALVADQSAYTHSPGTDLQVGRVVEAMMSGASQPMRFGVNTLGYSTQKSLYPTVFISGDDNLGFSVWPVPSQAGTLKYRYIAVPTQTATTLPDNVVAQWADVIACGAKSRILRIPGKAYTNAKLAPDYEQQFRAGINRAKITQQRGWITGGQQVSFRGFA